MLVYWDNWKYDGDKLGEYTWRISPQIVTGELITLV
jgi:hypothetical protein